MPPTPIKPSQPFTDKRTYIPPRVQQSLDRHAEQEQPPASAPPPAPPPAPLYPTGQAGMSAPMYPGAQPSPPAQPSQEYSFITNPEQPARRGWLPVGNSMPQRALLIGGGLLALLIIFVIIKSLFGGSSPVLTSFVGIAQDQQELIHLTTNADQQRSLTVNDQNFASTAQLSLASSQVATIHYLSSGGYKMNLKTLNLKLSANLDNQLANAAAASTYDQTFQDIIKTKLTAYLSNLQQTYKQTKGKNGRALLNDNYNQAQLLLTQLNSPAQ